MDFGLVEDFVSARLLAASLGSVELHLGKRSM